jgi:hypothetical protein
LAIGFAFLKEVSTGADVAINPDQVRCVGKVDNNRSYINLGNGVQITVEGTVNQVVQTIRGATT